MLQKFKIANTVLCGIFLASVVLVLLAIKLNWSVHTAFITLFVVILLLTILSMLVLSIISISKAVRQIGLKDFCIKLFKSWLGFLAIAVAVAFLKKDIDLPIILCSSFALAVLSYSFTHSN